jgi:uncharacterized protein with PIN domain
MDFLADAMLARLARWLRVLGFDTFFDATVHDRAIVELAASEGRLLLTRDRHLLRELRPPAALEIVHDAPLAQLRQVVESLRLEAPRELFTRCMLCNTVLSGPLPFEEVRALVPENSRSVVGPVRRCPSCLRVYWHGSHTRRMRAAIERALPGWLAPDAR